MTLSPELMEALEAAYSAFAHAPPPAKLETSTLRNGKAIHHMLTSRPLRELANADIGPYAGWAVTTVGNGEDYRHFLPRILELAIHDSVWIGTEPAVIAARLEKANWTNWPKVQLDAIHAVFRTAFSWTLANRDQEPAAWLAGMALIDGEMDWARGEWRVRQCLSAADGPASFVLAWLSAEQDGEIAPPFWLDVPNAERSRTRAWLLSDDTRTQLRRCLAAGDDDETWLIRRALDVL